MKTKLLASIIFPSLFFAFTTINNIPDFSGKWHAETVTSSFDLNLSQVKNKLIGSHCSVQMSGNKVDCVLDDTDLSLTGIIENPSYVLVTFTSQISQKNGTAKISKIDETTIEWKIITKPVGEYQIPNQIIMKKK
jgi:hypothetical protein